MSPEPVCTSNTNEQSPGLPTSGSLPDNFLDKLNPAARNYIVEQSLVTQREALRSQLIEKGRTTINDEDMSLYKRPRSGCRCSGSGRAGWDSKTGEVVLCKCMRRGSISDGTPDEFLSAKELMDILEMPKPKYPRKHIQPKSARKLASKERKRIKKNRKKS